MLETTRRRFLFGIGATGALLATPVPILELAEAATIAGSPPPSSDLPGSAVLQLVEGGSFSTQPVVGALEITGDQFRSISLFSDCRTFIPGPTTNELVLEGFIDKSLQDALMDGTVFPLSVKLPGLDRWISSRAIVREIAIAAPWVG